MTLWLQQTQMNAQTVANYVARIMFVAHVAIMIRVKL